jgi:hypothetical protein
MGKVMVGLAKGAIDVIKQFFIYFLCVFMFVANFHVQTIEPNVTRCGRKQGKEKNN